MARYISKYLELRIPIKKAYTKEVEGQTVYVSGQSVRFKEGVFETEDKKIIEFLDTDEGCKKMIGNGILIKADEETIKKAMEPEETPEEKEERLKKELAEVKKAKLKPKEKGEKTKVGKKKEKGEF